MKEEEYFFKTETVPKTPENDSEVEFRVYTDGEEFYVGISGSHFAVNDFLYGDPESPTSRKNFGKQLAPQQKPDGLEEVNPMLESQRPVAADGGERFPDPTDQEFYSEFGDEGYVSREVASDGGYVDEEGHQTMADVEHSPVERTGSGNPSL